MYRGQKNIIFFLMDSFKFYIINFIKELLIGKKASCTFYRKTRISNLVNNSSYNLPINFGRLNPKIIFYVIKRTPGAGFFSNVSFVVCNIYFALKKKYVPVVDMENFLTWYNERLPIKKSLNSWLYYFKPIKKYKLSEVYKSKNVLFSSNQYPLGYPMSISEDKNLCRIFLKYINVNKDILEIYRNYYNQNIKKSKVLGVHFRGCDLKSYRGHPFPATKTQMLNKCNYLISKYGFQKIFICTEEKDYLNFFIKNFGEKLIFFDSYRSFNNPYLYYPRPNHRYYLGRDILLEAMILSSCDGFLFTNSNVSEAVKLFNFNKSQHREKIDNGRNSNNFLIARFLWYFKAIIPEFLGGFKRFY